MLAVTPYPTMSLLYYLLMTRIAACWRDNASVKRGLQLSIGMCMCKRTYIFFVNVILIVA